MMHLFLNCCMNLNVLKASDSKQVLHPWQACFEPPLAGCLCRHRHRHRHRHWRPWTVKGVATRVVVVAVVVVLHLNLRNSLHNSLRSPLRSPLRIHLNHFALCRRHLFAVLLPGTRRRSSPFFWLVFCLLSFFSWRLLPPLWLLWPLLWLVF